jgi:hypothetical protein
VALVTDAQLLAAVDQVLDAINRGTDVETVRRASDAAYASYVFGLILRGTRLVADPTSVSLRSIWSNAGIPPKRFVVRGAPGNIYSTRHDYGYAYFRCNRRDYEIHLGVQYLGASRVPHEFDISIIDAADANASRRYGRQPGPGKAKLVFECKYYAGNLDISLGREFVGLLADFSSTKVARLVTNSGSTSIRAYLTDRVKYRLTEQLVPGATAAEHQFINAVADDLQNRLR